MNLSDYTSMAGGGGGGGSGPGPSSSASSGRNVFNNGSQEATPTLALIAGVVGLVLGLLFGAILFSKH